VALEECELVADDGLVFGAVVDVEVIDSGVETQLAVRGAPGGGDGRGRSGDLVGVADADQPWAVQVLGVATWVERAAEQPSRRGAVAPS
jgi:proteasome assembly chaperone (PAC2) family protein